MNDIKIKLLLLLSIAIILAGCQNSTSKSDVSIDSTGNQTEAYESGELVDEGNYYKVYKNEDLYCYLIFNNKEELAYKEYCYSYPNINLTSNTILQIRRGAGTGTWYCSYFDISTLTQSSTYYGAFHIKEQYIAYVEEQEGELQVKICDAFIPGKYEFVFKGDLNTDVANYWTILKSIDYIDDSHLSIEYLNSKGEFVTNSVRVPPLGV